MPFFLSLVFALILGYLIPVLASLFFSLLVGRVAPAQLAQGGRIKTGFVVVHGLVWALACLVSGYEIANAIPTFRGVTCVIVAVLLIGALLSNVEEMKKRQSFLQIGGMIVATMLGITAGLEIFLKTLKSV